MAGFVAVMVVDSKPNPLQAVSPTTRIWLLLLVLAAFAWRVHALDQQSLWRDEVDAIFFATRDLGETVRMFVQPAQNGPLYFLLLRLWFGLAGTEGFVLRYPSALAGALAIPLLWQVARRLAPGAPALLAAAFLAANPYQLWYGQEGKMYSVVTALVLLATWYWWQGITRGGWRPWLGYALTITAGIYMHLLLILIFPLHVLWFVLAWPQSRKHWRGYLAALAGLTLPYLPMVVWQWDLLTRSDQVTGFRLTPPLEMAQTVLYNYGRGFMPPDAPLWMAPIFFLGAAGLLLGGEMLRRQGPDSSPDGVEMARWRRWSLLVTWLVVPLVGIYLLSLRQPIFTDRYVIWIAPAAMIAVALGVQVVRRHAYPLGRPLAWLLLLYVLAFWLYAGWQQKMLPTKYALRSGVTYVHTRRGADELLILQIPHMQYPYRYYSSAFGPRPFADLAISEARLAPWHEGVWTNNGFADEAARQEVDQRMQAITAGFKVVWVLYSEVEMWDERHLMRAWLEEHGELVDQADFHGVQVRKYRLQ